MEPQEPYRPPQSELRAPSTQPAGGEITAGMMHNLKRTRPWVLFLGILMLLGCGFMVLISVFLMVAGGIAGMGEELGGAGGLVFGLVYLVLALLYLPPAVYLLRYQSAIQKIGGGNVAEAMEDALKHQASFWRFVGFLAALMIIIYLVIIVIVAVFAALAA